MDHLQRSLRLDCVGSIVLQSAVFAVTAFKSFGKTQMQAKEISLYLQLAL